MALTKHYLKHLTYMVNGAAIEVHKYLGPGLLESVYQDCLAYELTKRNIRFTSELKVPVIYDSMELNVQLRCDLFIENCLVLELKSAEGFIPIHEAQLLTYMRLLNAPKGILFNFNVVNLYKDGQKTFVNKLFGRLPES